MLRVLSTVPSLSQHLLCEHLNTRIVHMEVVWLTTNGIHSTSRTQNKVVQVNFLHTRINRQSNVNSADTRSGRCRAASL